jgi:glyoxylase-like metal-dependent hydrolase (beta-lactamase superfamily II)
VLNVHGEDGTVRGIFTGDILHHPIQCAYPNWNSRYCLDAEAARRSRNGLVDQCVDADRLIFPTHFAAPTAGRITSAGTRARFSPE